jgi:hypothetical protein
MTKTLLSPFKSGNIERYDFLKSVNMASPDPPPNCVGSGDGVNVAVAVEVNEGVKVRVGVSVAVRVGVDVTGKVEVWVGVSVKAGLNNWPDPQLERNIPTIRVIEQIVFPLILIYLL